jgi:fluoride exporter
MDGYVAASSPNAQRAHDSDPPARRPSASAAAASLFGLRDDRDSLSGEPVDDPDLETATDQVDTSLRCFCVTFDAVEKYLSVVVSISVGAYFGAGLRILLNEFIHRLTNDEGALLRILGAGYFLPNVIGCFVMGVATRCKPLVRDKFGVYLTGVTTGFCGCCTTFASWDVGVAAKLVHGLPVTAVLLACIQIASAFIGFRCGVQLAEALIGYFNKQSAPFPKAPVDAQRLQNELDTHVQAFEDVRAQSLPGGVTRRMAATKDALTTARDTAKELVAEIAQDEHLQPAYAHKSKGWAIVGVVLFLWLWIPPFVGFNTYTSSRLFGLALAPFGALLRYYLSLSNSKPQCRDFPWYTFYANMAATVLSCVVIIIGSAARNRSAYVFLGDGGLVVGFCGSLSTVSTWISEIDALASRKLVAAYQYAAVSVGVGLLVAFFLLGLYAISAHPPLIV